LFVSLGVGAKNVGAWRLASYPAGNGRIGRDIEEKRNLNSKCLEF